MNSQQTTNGLRWHAKGRCGSGQSIRAESRDESETGRWFGGIRDRLQQSDASGGGGRVAKCRSWGASTSGSRTEVAGLASVIAGYVEGVARELSASARREERLSSGSLVFGYVGGGLVILGFLLQIVGLFH